MKKIAIFLYSKSEIIAKPWVEAGIECHLFDLLLKDEMGGV